MELKRYWDIIWRRKWIIIQATVVIVLTTIVVCKLMTKVFEATCKIQIERQEDVGKLIPALSPWSTLDFIAPATVTQAEVIKSRIVMEKVIEKMQLKKKRTMVDKILNTFLRKRGRRTRIEEPLRIEYFVDPGFVTAFLQKRQVTVEDIEQSDIIAIKAQSNSLEEARDIANTVADTYIEVNENLKEEAGSSGVRFIQERLDKAKKELTNAENALYLFKQKEEATGLSEQTKTIVDELAKLESEKESTLRSLEESQNKLNSVKEQLSKQKPTLVSSTTVADNPQIQQLKTSLSELETQLAKSLTIYKPEHPTVVSLKNQIEQVKRKLTQEVDRIFSSETTALNTIYQELEKDRINIEVDITKLKAKEQTLSNSIKYYSELLSKLPDKEQTLARLERDVRVAESVYNMLAQQYDMAKIAEAMKIPNATIIERAVLPDKNKPLYPQTLLYTLISVFVGLLFGFVFAFLLEYLDDTVRTIEQVESLLGAPVLSVLPKTRKKGLKLYNSLKKNPYSRFADGMRRLQYLIRTTISEKSLKTLLIISPSPSKIQSTFIVSLAFRIGQRGLKTLLIDANLRGRGKLSKLLSLPSSPGLIELLQRKVSLEEVVQTTDTDGIYFIPSGGPSKEHPIDLLDAPEMPQLIERIKNEYDFILIDAPSVSEALDAVMLFSFIDNILFIVELGELTRQQLQRASDLLASKRENILGLILVNSDQ